MDQKSGRISKGRAKRVAAFLAEHSFDVDWKGCQVPIRHPVAVGVLRRAFKHCILRGHRPFSVQISEREARAFPSQELPPGAVSPKNIRFAIAVGFDLDMRLSFAVQGCSPDPDDAGSTPAGAVQAAEALARQNLARILGTSGLPGAAEFGGKIWL